MKKDGFLYEKIFILKNKQLNDSAHTYITDIGFFPKAKDHFRERANGSNEHIIILCVSGKGYINRNPIQTNSLVIIPEGVPHYYQADKDNPWDIYWVHFKTNNEMKYDGIKHIKLNKNQLLSLKLTFLNMLLSLEYSIDNLSLHLTSTSMDYILDLLKLFQKEMLVLPEIIRCANEYVFSNISNSICIDELCKICSTSKSKLHSIYKKQFNLSPIYYFTQLKMEIAANYIIATSMSIKQIAANLGYDDPYYFSRAFKKIYGLSPKNYRRENH